MVAKIQTTRSRTSQVNRGFFWVVTLSLLFHGGVVGGVVYAQTRKPPPVKFKSIPVELVRLGKKRDPKLLPRKVRPRPAPKKDGISLDDGKKTTKKKPKREEEISDAMQRLMDAKGNSLDDALGKIEDQEGDPDGDIDGTALSAENAARGYEMKVAKTLKQSYRLPDTIPASQRRFLVAVVVLFIERDGTIAKYEFEKEHPNRPFMGALETMLQSLKLPPPPSESAKHFRDVGIAVRFKP